MTTPFYDTPFGHLIRVLSSNRAFQYPDEIDPLLWKQKKERSLRRGDTTTTTSISTPAGEEHDAKDSDTQDGDSSQQQHLHVQPAVEDAKDSYLVDWYSADDPENPRNWPRSWKLLVAFQICVLNFAVYLASSIYVPGIESIMSDFQVSETVATLGLSLFTVGYGFGPMLWSPMSEMPKLGRSGIYFWTLLAYMLLQLPTGFAVNMPMFLIFRVLTGCFGSPSLATGGATMADLYDAADVPYAICIWASFGVCGPVFGPVIGGFVAPVEGWRWTIWVVTWLCAFVLVMLFFLLPETNSANILYRRARRLRSATGDDRLRSRSEIDAAHHTIRDELVVLSTAFTLTFSEPIVFFMGLYTALLYGVLCLWFESFPLVFGGIYGFNLGQQGLVFLGIFVGGIITVPLFLLWVRHSAIPRLTKPNFKPEMLLPPTFFGSASLPISLFWYGWSARPSIHWIMPIIGSSFFAVGIVTLFNAVLNYLDTSYPAYAASIFAGNTLFRASFGAIFPLFARALFHHLGIGPGNSLLGGIAICFLPIPFIFYYYGDRIRHASKNARHDI